MIDMYWIAGIMRILVYNASDMLCFDTIIHFYPACTNTGSFRMPSHTIGPPISVFSTLIGYPRFQTHSQPSLEMPEIKPRIFCMYSATDLWPFPCCIVPRYITAMLLDCSHLCPWCMDRCPLYTLLFVRCSKNPLGLKIKNVLSKHVWFSSSRFSIPLPGEMYVDNRF